ncbi:MAG: ATP-binding protein [Bacteroidia bacterium]|nr:ATP-binding protein [Bacteroidia bacterium]
MKFCQFLCSHFVILVALLTTQVTAQESRFEALPEEIGISNTIISDVIQDKQGFIWFATWSGLYRFDGYEVKAFRAGAGEEQGPLSNKITNIYESKEGKIWLATRSGGVSIFDPVKQKFSYLGRERGLSNLNVWTVKEDGKRNFWIGTEDGLFLLRKGEEKLEKYHWDRYPDQNFIYDLSFTSQGIWIGTEAGLFFWNRAKDGSEPHRVDLTPSETSTHSERDKTLNNYVYVIVEDPIDSTLIWVGTKGGLKKVKHENKGFQVSFFQHFPERENSLSHNFVRDIKIEIRNGTRQIWLATFHGLNSLNPNSKEVRRYFANDYKLASLKNDNVNALYTDRSGVLWIATDKGISKLNLFAKPFETIRLDQLQDPNKNLVSALAESPNTDCVVVGTRGGGLACIKENVSSGKTWSVRNLSFERHRNSAKIGFISSLAVRQNGDLWVATQGEGVLMIPALEWQNGQRELKNYLQYSLSEGNLLDDYAMSTYRGSRDEIWIGHWDGGINCYLPSKEKVLHFATSSDSKVDFRLFPNVAFLETTDSQGRNIIWVGTRGGGLHKMEFNPEDETLNLIESFVKSAEGKFKHFNNFLDCLYEDDKKRVWIGTENGIYIQNDHKKALRHLSSKDGLPNDIIQGILQDKEGKMWVSTFSGMCKLDYSDSLRSCNSYFKEHGLQEDLFATNCGFLSRNGRVFFGGINGVNAFFPQDIRKDTITPKVVITGISLFNKPLDPNFPYEKRQVLIQSPMATEKISLKYNDRVVSISFAGMHFAQPSQNQYAYKLEGFDKDWVFTDAQHRIAHYTNLRYKNYTFKVKAANPDGLWADEVKTLEIKVSPPWWLSNWAKIGYGILTILVFVVIRQIILMRLNFRNRLKLERLEREKLEELDRLKNQFFTNISHELRTPLTLILTPLEEMVKNKIGELGLRQTFSRMHRNGNRLLQMINQILDLSKSEAGLLKLAVAEGDILKFIREILISFEEVLQQKNIAISLESRNPKVFIWYDRDQMEKVFFNLISNAIKFTPNYGSIAMSIVEDHEKIILQVKDSGSGIDAEDLPHIFDRFYQGRVGHSKSYQGTGVGLALTKNIIKAHEGEIWLESELGSGTSFFFSLKKGDKHFKTHEKLVDFKGSEELSVYVSQNLASVPLNKVGSPTSGIQEGFSEKKVLIIEDNDDIRDYLCEYLGRSFVVIDAPNGKIGLEMALSDPPDLIVSDIAMPEMNGLELCKEVKSHVETSHIPVILLTARTSLIFKITGYETGADDYVTKPFQMKALQARIINLIQSREKLKKKFSQGGYELSPSQIAVGSLDEKFLANVIAIIEKHMDDSSFSVEIMGNEIGMSRMQLYRKLKALTGESPNQVIRNIRLKRAAQLLKTKQFTVSEVTYKVGFQDLKYFRERFKKEYGVSPSEYVGNDE